jgi:pyochelin biosynthesis protein PchC
MTDRCSSHVVSAGSSSLVPLSRPTTTHPSPQLGALVCCPHAGGGANFFRPWANRMPLNMSLWALQYPGREERLNELANTCMHTLVQTLLPSLQALDHTPYVLLGHSMGAAVAFELTLRLQDTPHAPRALLLSSHPPPDAVVPTQLHQQDDAALWQELTRIGGTSQALLQHTELLRMLAPTLRADYTAIETHQFDDTARIDLPVVVCTGDDDPDVPVTGLPGWQRFCTQTVVTHVFQGGHFYLAQHHVQLIGLMQELLAPALAMLSNEPEVSWP